MLSCFFEIIKIILLCSSTSFCPALFIMHPWAQKDIERNGESKKKNRQKEKRDSQREQESRKSMRVHLTFPNPPQKNRIRAHVMREPKLSLTALARSLHVRKQEHLTTTQHIKPSCKMPARHVWRFAGCICYSKLISAWRCKGTKCRVMLWRSDMSLTRPQRKEKQVHRNVVMEKGGSRKWQWKKHKRNKTQENIIIKEK